MSNYTTLIEAMKATGKNEFSRPEVVEIAREVGASPNLILTNSDHKIRRGVYAANSVPTIVADNTASNVDSENSTQVFLNQPKLNMEINDLVPSEDSTYVPFGFHAKLKKIIKSNSFYPTYITGLSGNGKTTMVEQVCASLGRECIRVNISIETDEDDLIGSNTLVDGNVVYREGPVTIAMRRGAILLLDEVDRGSNKLMCLQPVLEGKPYFNKKTGETIFPKKGFNVCATSNTKGQGTEDGRFISAQILDDAFLERFAITVEQEYPSPSVEKKLLKKKMELLDIQDEDFIEKLTTWSSIIRKTFLEGAVDEVISTRRLIHIVNAFAMFGDRLEAIEYCVSRFNTETKESFIDLYTKVDAGEVNDETEEEPENEQQETFNND